MAQSGARYTRRVQTMFTPHQYELLREYAAETRKPMSVIVRETVVRHLLEKIEQQRKQNALRRLCSGDAPVSDWPEMERQIETMWEGTELEKIEQQRKRKAFEWLCSQNLPVDDWEVMERQIETMWETYG